MKIAKIFVSAPNRVVCNMTQLDLTFDLTLARRGPFS